MRFIQVEVIVDITFMPEQLQYPQLQSAQPETPKNAETMLSFVEFVQTRLTNASSVAVMVIWALKMRKINFCIYTLVEHSVNKVSNVNHTWCTKVNQWQW